MKAASAKTKKLWYHRTFKAPQLNDGRRLLLHFGAVDWHCEAFVNGKSVGNAHRRLRPLHPSTSPTLSTNRNPSKN